MTASIIQIADSISCSMVYGAQAIRETVVAVQDAGPSIMISGPYMQFTSIVVLISYALLLYRFSGALSIIVKELRTKNIESKLKDSHSRDYVSFTRLAQGIGILSLAIVVSKLSASFFGRQIETIFPAWLLSAACMGVLAIILTVVLYQKLLLYAVGAVILNAECSKSLSHLKKIHFTLSAVIITPTLLLYSTFGGVWDSIFLYISIAEAIMITCVFLYRTYSLFVGQKISILYWFLYLCIVELFPISLIISILLRII